MILTLPLVSPGVEAIVTARRLSHRQRVLVTAADSLFFESLVNLIGSMHRWEPEVTIVAFDLGLTARQHEQLAAYCRVEVRRFPWEAYPGHLRPEHRNYGWKAHLVLPCFGVGVKQPVGCAWQAVLILALVREDPSRLVFYQAPNDPPTFPGCFPSAPDAHVVHARGGP